jgi:hypothetical protein
VARVCTSFIPFSFLERNKSGICALNKKSSFAEEAHHPLAKHTGAKTLRRDGSEDKVEEHLYVNAKPQRELTQLMCGY